jgi:hypothetical protein
MRRLLVASFGALYVGSSVAACSAVLGDFAVTQNEPGDAGQEAEGPLGDSTVDASEAASTACQAMASAADVYVGQTASVDGTKSTGSALTYSWTVRSAPAGSQVTTDTLQGAKSAVASFVADVAGDYEFVLVVSSATCTGDSAPAPVKVTARPPRVVFAEGHITDAGASATYTVADLDGGNAHPLLCPDSVVTPVPDQIAMLAAYSGRAYDFWEAPSGQPSKYAAFTVDRLADAYFTHLWVGTLDSSCSSPPMNLTTGDFGPGPPFGSEPHFSPDGSRFVVYDAHWNLITYPADGTLSGKHIVAAYDAGQSGPPAFDAGFDPISYQRPAQPPRAEWTATGIAWARATTTGWEVVTAPDLEGSSPISYMQCSGVTPRQIAMLRDGTVIAGYRQTPTSGEDIYLLKPSSSQACVVDQKYTSSSSDAGTATATDFAVSPDGKWLAYLALDPTVQDAAPWTLATGDVYPGGYVNVTPIAVPDGGVPQPRQVSTEPAMYGPRWIGGGTLLAFTRLDDARSGSAPATSVVVVSPDGGASSVVASGDGVKSFVSTSGSGGCSLTRDVWGGGSRCSGGLEAAGIAMGGIIAGALRRRRRQQQQQERRAHIGMT